MTFLTLKIPLIVINKHFVVFPWDFGSLEIIIIAGKDRLRFA